MCMSNLILLSRTICSLQLYALLAKGMGLTIFFILEVTETNATRYLYEMFLEQMFDTDTNSPNS